MVLDVRALPFEPLYLTHTHTYGYDNVDVLDLLQDLLLPIHRQHATVSITDMLLLYNELPIADLFSLSNLELHDVTLCVCVCVCVYIHHNFFIKRFLHRLQCTVSAFPFLYSDPDKLVYLF